MALEISLIIATGHIVWASYRVPQWHRRTSGTRAILYRLIVLCRAAICLVYIAIHRKDWNSRRMITAQKINAVYVTVYLVKQLISSLNHPHFRLKFTSLYNKLSWCRKATPFKSWGSVSFLFLKKFIFLFRKVGFNRGSYFKQIFVLTFLFIKSVFTKNRPIKQFSTLI